MMRKDKPQVLVTGAGGELSRLTIKKLKKDYNLVAVDFRESAIIEKSVPSYKINFNKRGFEDIFRRHDFDFVIHLGRISTSAADPYIRYNANVLGTNRLLSLSAKYNVKQVLILSTYFIYGANAYNPSLIIEDSPHRASELSKDLIDAVELDNHAVVYYWKNPELNITVLRPCNIVGPGMHNTMTRILYGKIAPVMAGFSPMMQFIHVEDMADAIYTALIKNKPGIYNVAPDDWIPYQDALLKSKCKRLPLPSIPPVVPRAISKIIPWKAYPDYLINYLKYPVIINGSLFNSTFNFKTKYSFDDIFKYYSEKK